ncbi:MAG: DMT family transporter [Lachnospiraceae bacterium]|nr:DMT family transporter [Lachnospiraceae bacterium]
MKKLAPFLILIAGLLWGSMGLFVRRLNGAGFGSMEIVALRALVTAVVLFLFLIIYDRKLLKIRIRDIWCFLGTGICSIVFFNYCYFKAMTMISLSAAAVLLYTAPAMVMVMSWFLFHEKLTKRKLFALLFTFLGCILVTGFIGGGSQNGGAAAQLSPMGILTGLGAGFGYALYSIFSRFAIKRGYASITISFYTFLIAFLGALPLTGGSFLQKAGGMSGSMIGFAVIFGVVSTVIPYLTYTLGLAFVENSKASIIASVEPVAATLLGVLVFHEPMSAGGTLGMLMILASIALCS